jgi:long-chain fatty acid transport protein
LRTICFAINCIYWAFAINFANYLKGIVIMKRHFKHKLTSITVTLALAALSSEVAASDFNIPFVNASGLGNLYAGWASSAEDASTQFTNPAGLTKLHNPQFVMAGIGLTGSTQFNGTSQTPLFPFRAPETGTVSSKLRGFIPSFYYAIPLSRNIVFGFGQTIPFALGTNYAKDSVVRYAATRSQIAIADLGPSIGIQVNDKLSVGFGIDANRLAFTLNRMTPPPLSFTNAEAQNHLSGWGFGWHGGVLYQALPTTRIGLSFNSMVMFHTTGDSEVFTPMGEIRTTNQKANSAMPARTQVSINHDIGKFSLMGTVFYTNWSTFTKLTLKHTMTTVGTMPVVIPFDYHNTFDYAVGLNYKANEKWLWRTGVMFLTSPSNNQDRSVVDPIACGVIVGIGAHYQQNKRLGYDVSYARGFFQDTHIHAVTPISSVIGSSSQNTNLLGAQVTWDIV